MPESQARVWVRQATGHLWAFLHDVETAGPKGSLCTRNQVFRWRKRLAARGIDLCEVMTWKQVRLVERVGIGGCREVTVFKMLCTWRPLLDATGLTVSTGEPAGCLGDVEPATRSAGGPASPVCPVVFLRAPTGAVVIASEASAP